MAKYYTIKNNQVLEIESIRSPEFIERAQKIKVYKTLKSIPVPDGHKLSGREIVPTSDKIKQDERNAAIQRLAEIDVACLRPLRAIASGTATDDDRNRLSVLEQEAYNLRLQLK
jgi:hypothetical protein